MKLAAQDVKAIRKYYGINQTQLASKLGVTQSYVAHWERGAADVPAYVAERLAIDNARLDAMYEALAEREAFLF